jgi:hypothetical protein
MVDASDRLQPLWARPDQPRPARDLVRRPERQPRRLLPHPCRVDRERPRARVPHRAELDRPALRRDVAATRRRRAPARPCTAARRPSAGSATSSTTAAATTGPRSVGGSRPGGSSRTPASRRRSGRSASTAAAPGRSRAHGLRKRRRRQQPFDLTGRSTSTTPASSTTAASTTRAGFQHTEPFYNSISVCRQFSLIFSGSSLDDVHGAAGARHRHEPAARLLRPVRRRVAVHAARPLLKEPAMPALPASIALTTSRRRRHPLRRPPQQLRRDPGRRQRHHRRPRRHREGIASRCDSVWDDRRGHRRRRRQGSRCRLTAPVTVNATSEATATTIKSATAVTFDGSTTVKIECFVPYVLGSAGNQDVTFCLYDGASSIGLLGKDHAWATFANPIGYLTRKLTPAAATKTYSLRAFVDANTVAVQAGVGGSGAIVPGFIRITKV